MHTHTLLGSSPSVRLASVSLAPVYVPGRPLECLSPPRDASKGGVRILNPPPCLRLALRGEPALSLALRRYDEALKLLQRHGVLSSGAAPSMPSGSRASTSSDESAGSGPLVAWIFDPSDPVRLHPAALEAQGIPLASLLFLQSARPEATLQSACELDAFGAIVVEARPSRAALRTAHRWTKPPAAEGVFKADALETFLRHKLVVFVF